MRAVLRTDRPLLHDVLDSVFTPAGIQIVDRTSDHVTLFASVARFQPDIVVLMTADLDAELGLCGDLLGEYSHLKILILSSGGSSAIVDSGVRVRRFQDLSVESIRGLLAERFATD